MDEYTTQSHESYGLIEILKVNSNNINLFGSGINHNTCFSLRISKAVLDTSAYTDFYSADAKGKIIEVYLSPAQFVQMITSIGSDGVPCTIKYVNGEGYKENPPKHNIKQKLQTDLKNQFKDLANRVQKLSDTIDEKLKGKLLKKDKEAIKTTVNKIAQDISQNLPYLQQCQTKKLEEIGTQIVSEAESQISSLIYNKGLEKLLNTNKKLIE